MDKGITVLVPTRERPRQARELLDSFEATRVLPTTNIVFGIDRDEPKVEEYTRRLGHVISCPANRSGSFSKVLNQLADLYPSDIMGSVGDDHRFVTRGWDSEVTKALDSWGLAYANDQYPFTDLPTAAFLSGEIVEGLGWFANPVLDHMYIDNSWLDIGHYLKNIQYLNHVVIEHRHYTANKSNFDESYARTNTNAQKEKDRLAYEYWRKHGGYAEDMERLGEWLTLQS